MVPVCQSVIDIVFAVIVVDERNTDLLGLVLRSNHLLSILHIFAVVTLVGDLLSTDLSCRWINGHDLVTTFYV